MGNLDLATIIWHTYLHEFETIYILGQLRTLNGQLAPKSKETFHSKNDPSRTLRWPVEVRL